MARTNVHPRDETIPEAGSEERFLERVEFDCELNPRHPTPPFVRGGREVGWLSDAEKKLLETSGCTASGRVSKASYAADGRYIERARAGEEPRYPVLNSRRATRTEEDLHKTGEGGRNADEMVDMGFRWNRHPK